MGFDLTGRSGNYFRANAWSWRPIMCLVHELNEALGLPITAGWEYNDGAGLHSQADCDKLAEAIEKHVAEGRQRYVMASDCRVDDAGRFLRDDQPGGKSAYETDADHILEFARFLRECGGSFEIW